jgi:hypothetical protein
MSSPPGAARHPAFRALLFFLALHAASALAATAPPAASRFFDADGALDISSFLDTAYGFVPLVAPITEPAIGYGAAGALVFIDRDTAGKDRPYTRPNMGVIGGLATENGTRGVFAVHLGTWLDGNLRTLVGVVDADVNLDFFGLGGDRRPGDPGLGYSIGARGGVAGASYRIGDSPLWIGLRYAAAQTSVAMSIPGGGLPGVAAPDFDLRLAGFTPSVTWDTRNNFFTPTQGLYVDLSVPVFREALGGDRNFETANLTAMGFQPLGRSVFASARMSAKTSSDGTPFYLRPFISLRGVQALRYQGERAAEAEAELRWQFTSRFSAVAFAGTGKARSDAPAAGDREKSVSAGGVGVRYLLASKHGLHMGLDVAAGPDKPIFYLVFGNAWIRP